MPEAPINDGAFEPDEAGNGAAPGGEGAPVAREGAPAPPDASPLPGPADDEEPDASPVPDKTDGAEPDAARPPERPAGDEDDEEDEEGEEDAEAEGRDPGDAVETDGEETGGAFGEGAAPVAFREGADGLVREAASPAAGDTGDVVAGDVFAEDVFRDEVAFPAAESEGPPPPPRGTPLRIPAARTRRPGVLPAVLRAAWEELNYPRARVRAAMRRAGNRMRERRLVASLFWGTFAGATFILYASGVGVVRGALAWAALLATGAGLAAGAPAALVHAWPAAVAAALAGCVWMGWAFGAGALWLAVATCAGLLSLYFAAAELGPLAGAAGVSWAVWRLTASAEGGPRLVAAGVALAASATLFVILRKRVTAPILAAAWVLVSGAAAARAAWWTLGEAVPGEWAVQVLPGPPGIVTCLVGAAFGTALFSWPRRREVLSRTQALFAP